MVLIFDNLSRKSRYLKNKRSPLFFSTPFSVDFCRRALCIFCMPAAETARMFWHTDGAFQSEGLMRSD